MGIEHWPLFQLDDFVHHCIYHTLHYKHWYGQYKS